jgi:MarR family transcriptional regulator for hemolysin
VEKLNEIIFFTIDNSIKAYRQFAQKRISEAGLNITIDQWLVLKTIEEDATVTQQELAGKVFKDIASVTRMIELLVNKGFLSRKFHKQDRRRFALSLTKEGTALLEKLQPYILSNRDKALAGVTSDEIRILQATLLKITSNVQQ